MWWNKRMTVLICIWALMTAADVVGMYAREFGIVLLPAGLMSWVVSRGESLFAFTTMSNADLIGIALFAGIAAWGTRSILMTILGMVGYIMAGGCAIVFAKLSWSYMVAQRPITGQNLVLTGWFIGTLVFAFIGWVGLMASFRAPLVKADAGESGS